MNQKRIQTIDSRLLGEMLRPARLMPRPRDGDWRRRMLNALVVAARAAAKINTKARVLSSCAGRRAPLIFGDAGAIDSMRVSRRREIVVTGGRGFAS